MIKERPILFSGAMVRAILDGRKTVTRRVVKPQPANDWRFTGGYGRITSKHPHKDKFGVFIRRGEHTDFTEVDIIPCPYGQPGDHLWVRETCFINGPSKGSEVIYKADPLPNWEGEETDIRWRPSIHMPRWASRIQLEITAVRVERLQEISEEQAQAEGIERDGKMPTLWKRGPLHGDQNLVHVTNFPKLAFRSIWEAINGPESWGANPWVWVVEFHRIDHQEQSYEN
ncbi:MAG: hypothetical protein CMK74_01975 [Pseudomonadales bacterium]|nr:hypothetical protein [Pseudomonadales bacterium]|tara:strand:+ start:403 stop:1086 length:684 start_codon:yes stop_codon:yes gene_type:complete